MCYISQVYGSKTKVLGKAAGKAKVLAGGGKIARSQELEDPVRTPPFARLKR